MARSTRAAAHVSVEEVKSRLHNDPRPWCRKRWLIIYNALVDPRKVEEIATAAEMQRAFEARVGHEVDDTTIYCLLARHGWQKLMPRPTHPKANKEAQEQFKKTLRAPRSGGSRNTPSRRSATSPHNGSR